MDEMVSSPQGGNEEVVESLDSGLRHGGGGGSSLAERRAAKFGFDASRIKMPRLPSSRLLSSSPPPSVSPTVLLDSPIMLPNTQAQLSPTTGSFRVPSYIHETSVVPPADGGVQANNLNSSCKFNSHANPISLPCFYGIEDQHSSPSNMAQSFGAEVQYQTSAPTHSPMEFESAKEFSREASAKNYVCSATDAKASDSTNSDMPRDHMSQYKEPTHCEDVGMLHIAEEPKGAYLLTGGGRTSEDGYNWRKYGQKPVKGSEHTRSYYKCTHPSCKMKKKVEQSHDSQITEIIYKGGHNHPKPQPSRRSALGSALSFCEMSGPGESEGGSIWKNIQPGSKQNLRANNWERISSTSSVSELSNPLSNTPGQSMGIFESAGTPEFSTTVLASQDDVEEGTIQGSTSLGDDFDDEDSESRKRKKEHCITENNLASSRAVREPRVVVQVESELDVLDDGYRWRKYGQKVVKGNVNPRSYYKCTSTGCSVRRHVERASNNMKSVITTYEGKHNHEVPAARNSHVNSSGGNLASAAGAGAGAGAQSALHLHRNAAAYVPRAEALLQDLGSPFDMKPEFNNEYLRSSMLGNFANDHVKFGPPSLYSVQFPPLPFGLDSNNAEPHQPGSVAPIPPNFPISLPLSLASPANLGLPSFDFNSHGNPSQVQPSFVGQRFQDNDMRFFHPKEE